MNITLVKLSGRWRAESDVHGQHCWGEGDSKKEAVGDLILTRQATLDVKITYEAQIFPDQPVAAEACTDSPCSFSRPVPGVSRACRPHRPLSLGEIQAALAGAFELRDSGERNKPEMMP